MTSRISYESTIEINDEEIDVHVEADYRPGYAGTMYNRYGDPGDPPEPAEINVVSVIRCDDGREIVRELSVDDLDILADRCPEDDSGATDEEYRITIFGKM